MQAASHRRGPVPAEVRFDTRFPAHCFEQRLRMRAVGSLGRAAGAAVGVRVARNDIGERKLPAHRDQSPGERYRVAATLAPVHADNDVFEHLRSSHLTFPIGDGPTVRRRSLANLTPIRHRLKAWMAGLAGITAICPALMLSLVRGAA